MLVEPTALTARRATEVFGPLLGSTEQLAAGYGAGELGLILDFLVRWRAALTAHGDRLSAGPPP